MHPSQNIEDAFRELVNKEFEIREDIVELQDGEFTISQMQAVNERIKQKQEILAKHIKSLKLRAEENDSEKVKLHILERLKIHEKESEELRAALRKANLVSKKNLENRYEKERGFLLEGGEEALKLHNERAREDMLRTSKSITEGLRRTRSAMNSEVERTNAAIQALEEDKRTISSITQTHTGYTASLRTGRGLLNKLKAREITDRFLIFFGVFVFLLVVLYTIKVRLKFTIFNWFMSEY